jgi:hypothetical protein
MSKLIAAYKRHVAAFLILLVILTPGLTFAELDPHFLPWYGEIGRLAHTTVEQYFLRTGPGLFRRIEVSTPDRTGRADMVVYGFNPEDPEGDPAPYEIYELKPWSYRPGGPNNALGKAQLQRYMVGLGGTPGVDWNPNGVGIPGLWDGRITIRLYTFYGTDPGMVYYQVEVPDPRLQPQPVPAWWWILFFAAARNGGGEAYGSGCGGGRVRALC